MITDEQFYSLADNAHFLGGACATLLPLAMGAPTRRGALYAAVAILLYAAVKEYFIDPREETPEVAGSGLRDFLGYAAGVAAAWACIGVSALWRTL